MSDTGGARREASAYVILIDRYRATHRSGVGRLRRRPCPSSDTPTGLIFFQSQRPYRAGLLNQRPLLLVAVSRGNDDIGSVCRDIDVPGLAEGDALIGVRTTD